MNQNKQPEALRLADICAKKGLFAVEDELRRLHAESELHQQELRSYRITVENREARIAELEKQLGAVQQGVPDVEPAAWVATFKPEGLLALHSVVGANLEDLKQSVPGNSVFRPLYTHPSTQGLDAQTTYEAACFRWLRDESLKARRSGPVVFMTDEDGNPNGEEGWGDNILTGEALERAIPVAAQAKQGEQANG